MGMSSSTHLLRPRARGGANGAQVRCTASLDPNRFLVVTEGSGEWPEARGACLARAPVGRGPDALRSAARSWDEFLAQCPDDVSLEEIAANAAFRRTHHDHRLGVVAHSKQELAERLREFAEGRATAGVAEGRASAERRPRLAFVCSGQGPQWWAMGRQLLRRGADLPRRDRALRRDRATAWRLVAASTS